MKNKFIYIYYFALIAVLILYTNTSGSPNTLIRLGYLAALVVPLIGNVAIYPAVVLCALCISKNTFAYPFMPTEIQYYVILSIVFAVLARLRSKERKVNRLLFIVILIYIAVNDLLFYEKISELAIMLFIMLLLSICSEKNIESSSTFLQLTFVLLSLAISYWVLFCPEASINIYNSAGDMEQVGWRDPNYLGCALGTGLVVSAKEVISEKKKSWSFYLALITIILSVFALLSIASRGISLAVAASVCFLLLFSKVKTSTKILAVLAIIIFLIYLYTNEYFDLLFARFGVDDGTGSGRTEIWASKLHAFFEEGSVMNYLFGFGQSGGFNLGSMGGRSTHNDYVAVLIYYGFFGFSLFISAIAFTIRKCSKEERPQIAALMIYLLMCSMSIEPLCMGNIAYLAFFFYITQLARISRLKRYPHV